MPKFADACEAAAAARAFDLKQLPADFIDDPYPYFHALREHDPVHRMPDGGYIITRYDDCEAVYKDARIYSSDKKVEFLPKYTPDQPGGGGVVARKAVTKNWLTPITSWDTPPSRARTTAMAPLAHQGERSRIAKSEFLAICSFKFAPPRATTRPCGAAAQSRRRAVRVLTEGIRVRALVAAEGATAITDNSATLCPPTCTRHGART